MTNLTYVTVKSFKEDAPTTFDHAGEAAAADNPVANCFGKIKNQGKSKTKINTKAGKKVFTVDF